MSRVAFTSAVLLLCHTVIREFVKFGFLGYNGVDSIRIFEAPVAIMGSLTLYLALLIMSSKHYYYRNKWSVDEAARHRSYVVRNAAMIAALLTGMMTGAITGSGGMLNTALTFLVLFVGEKYAEFHLENKWNGCLLLLMGSLTLYEIALWLHDHPDFLVSLMKG